jgi:hypothetical protein
MQKAVFKGWACSASGMKISNIARHIDQTQFVAGILLINIQQAISNAHFQFGFWENN